MKSMVRTKRLLTVVGLLFVLSLILIACGGKPFGKIIPEYTNIKPTQAHDLSKPYIVGKIVVANVSDNTYSDLNNQLGDLKANNTSEVGTIVWVDCCNASISVNSGQIQSYTFTVSIIDAKANQVVGKKDFTYQPEAGTRLRDLYKLVEHDALLWIENLPRK